MCYPDLHKARLDGLCPFMVFYVYWLELSKEKMIIFHFFFGGGIGWAVDRQRFRSLMNIWSGYSLIRLFAAESRLGNLSVPPFGQAVQVKITPISFSIPFICKHL